MATKADFTEDEWDALHKGVTGAGLLVSVGDRDFTDTFGEAGALAKQLREAHERSTSELVRELAGTRGTGFGFTDLPREGGSGDARRPAVGDGSACLEGAGRGRCLPAARSRRRQCRGEREGRRQAGRDRSDREDHGRARYPLIGVEVGACRVTARPSGSSAPRSAASSRGSARTPRSRRRARRRRSRSGRSRDCRGTTRTPPRARASPP